MAFVWKDKKDIWKGEGIYFVTFAVSGRERLLGNLVRINDDQTYTAARPNDNLTQQQLEGKWDVAKYGEHKATVRLNALGFAVANDLLNIKERHPGYEICGKQIMENHLHVVIWVHDDGSKSIKQWAHGFRIGITQMAREMGLWPVSHVGGEPVLQGDSMVHDMHQNINGKKEPTAIYTTANNTTRLTEGATANNTTRLTEGATANSATRLTEGATANNATRLTEGATANNATRLIEGTTANNAAGTATDGATAAANDTRHEGGLLFEKAFIRTLAHRGQLRNMLDYTHNNPENLLLMIDNPELYTIRRNQQHGGLLFDTMGKRRLLDYPDRNVVALSRSLTAEQIKTEVQEALRRAERGTVTYCAAINDGEKAVTKAIREAGYPLVVMMLDGFPAEGTDTARFFHPGGTYHKACGEGRLYLMAPLNDNYNDTCLIGLTNSELQKKAEEKGYRYNPIPHDSKRWRMIAGNVMLRMIAISL